MRHSRIAASWRCAHVTVAFGGSHGSAADANAHAERWVRSVAEECLDHLILVGLGSLQRALRIYVSFFNNHRPHQGLSNRIPMSEANGNIKQIVIAPEEKLAVGCEQFLGGLLNSYYRKAA